MEGTSGLYNGSALQALNIKRFYRILRNACDILDGARFGGGRRKAAAAPLRLRRLDRLGRMHGSLRRRCADASSTSRHRSNDRFKCRMRLRELYAGSSLLAFGWINSNQNDSNPLVNCPSAQSQLRQCNSHMCTGGR